MIIRYIEVCPKCGQWMPWRKVTTKFVKGEKTQYSKCCRCGAKETIVYRHRSPTMITSTVKPQNAPQ